MGTIKVKQNTEVTQKEFFSVLMNVIRTAMVILQPINRWLKVHNLFILKEFKNHKISRTRTLHKLDAELNLVYQHFVAHKATQQAERHHHLTDEQYARKGCQAINPMGITTLFREALHIQQSNEAMTDFDAAAYYGKILSCIASIAEINTGVPNKILTLCARTLQQMEYHKCTGQGISEEYNKHEKIWPIFGVDQGAMDVPSK
eukprot:15335730-Ditylum_brightwellii.AAC.1